jgi:hypothetical protein
LGPGLSTLALAWPQGSAPRQPYSRGSMFTALAIAADPTSREQARSALAAQAYTAGSTSAREAKLAIWAELAQAAGFADPFLISEQLVYTVVGCLKAAGTVARRATCISQSSTAWHLAESSLIPRRSPALARPGQHIGAGARRSRPALPLSAPSRTFRAPHHP